MNPLPEKSTAPVRSGRARGWLLPLFLSLATALIIVSPFFVHGTASGHDFTFHAASWLDAAGQWRQGVAYPRWAEWADWGFGEPRFVFYPPLSWMLGAALGQTVGWKAAVIAFIVVTQTLAGLSMFALGRRTLEHPAAMFASFCYAANPYALLIIFLRSDYAELLAAAVFPLLFLTLSDALGDGDAAEKRSITRGVVNFAAVYAVIWLCNAPAGVLASYAAALVMAYAAMRGRNWRPLVRGGAGLALGLGLAAFYLVPAIYEQKWVHIEQALSTGLTPAENFLYAVIDDPEHNLFNWIASTAAVVMIVVTGFAAVIARRESARGAQRITWQRFLLVAAAATLLMLRFSSPAWSFLPKLRYVQFPWRGMLPLAVPFAYFLAAAARRRRGWVWVVVGAVLFVSGEMFLVHRAWWDRADVPQLREKMARGAGYEGTDEYDVLGGDHYYLPQNAAQVSVLPPEDAEAGANPAADVRIERWSAEEKFLEVNARGPVRVALRLVNYPAWRVEVNGAAVAPEYAEDTAQMVVPLGAGVSRVTVRFRRTPDRTMGGLLSAGSVLFGVALLFWPGQLKQKTLG